MTRIGILACLLLSMAMGPRTASSYAATADAAILKRDSARCRTNADVDACYDAIRWSPSDPALLVALGDALERAQRPADAIRNYRRAAVLAPATRGIAVKISQAEAKLAAMNSAPARRYSNAAPEAQSH
jgi:hypothetical protein